MYRKEERVWVWIKYRLLEAGSSLSKLARLEGVTRQALSSVKHSSYPKLERRIAESIGLTASDLWPHRYGIYTQAILRAREKNQTPKTDIRTEGNDSGEP